MEKPVDKDTGQFAKEVSDDNLVAAVAGVEPAGTTTVAEAVDMTRPGAYRRLQTLEDAGRVTVSRIGGSLVWSSADDLEVAAGADHVRDGNNDEGTNAANVDGDLRDRVEASLEAGEYAVTATRVGAAVAVVETVRDRGEVTTTEATEIAREKGVTLGTVEQWWSETARPLEIVATERGSNTYQWVGDDGGETA